MSSPNYVVTIDQLRDRLNELIDKFEEIQITQARLEESVLEVHLTIEDLDEDLYDLRTRKLIESEEGLDTYRASLGKEVRIVNPGPGEYDIGIIRSVTESHVHVDLPNGTSRRRLPSNLRLRHYERKPREREE